MAGRLMSVDESPLLGIDLGAAAVKVALVAPGGALIADGVRPTQGRPLAALADALTDLGAADDMVVRVGATGGGRTLLGDDVPVRAVNEVLAAAVGARAEIPDARGVIDMGGQFAKWVALDDDGGVRDFATNGLCAAGSGAFLEQQAARLQLSEDELGRLADGAARGATIAGRCSVFAKSDMIHLQQKGTPSDEIAYGLCLALARTFLSTVVGGRDVPLPVALVGGGAENPGIRRAFRELLEVGEEDLRVPVAPRLTGAVGAALLAGEAAAIRLGDLRAAVRAVAESGEGGGDGAGDGADGTAHAPLPAVVAGVRLAEEPPVPPGKGAIRAWLGVDVGSVSTNLVLLRADDDEFQPLLGVYLPTRGRPADVLREGLERIHARFGERLAIVGVGTTGSGRHLAAELLGADAVHNEITAQTVSAAYFAPDVDTIFEIGGQDAKYVSVRDGHLADFEMNRICSAGTGSFLEEQGRRLGVEVVPTAKGNREGSGPALQGEFALRALAAPSAPDLGTRCTVFMDAELVRAQQRGASVDALCAGLAYSVARNYLDKVVGGRPIGRHILFQGGTASNAAVVAAFQALLGRPVTVHPYNRLSGAFGAGLLAARAYGDQPYTTRFRGLDAVEAPEVSSFECRHCDNRCQVNRIRVGDRLVHFGDSCERFAARDREVEAVERPFPELFAAREALFERHVRAAVAAAPEGAAKMGLVRGSLGMEYLVLWATILAELGYEPVLSPRGTPRLLRDHGGGVPSETCLPIKTAAAQANALLATGACERVFVPGLLECGPRPGLEDEAAVCLFAQQLPDMLRMTHAGRIVTARLALDTSPLGRRDQVRSLARVLRRPVEAVDEAFEAALGAYRRFTDGRRALGVEALAAPFERGVVVLGKPYNTHDPLQNLSLARHLERAGLFAIPFDLLPLDDVHLDARWDSVPWHYNRAQLRAAEWLRSDPRLFPLVISSYGCGPDGFTAKHLETLFAGRPRLFLEFDEHQGEAGLVTRIEAFADELEVHLRSGRAAEPGAAARPSPGPPRPEPHETRRFFIPDFAETAGIYAAVLRAAGYEARVLPKPDADSVRLGEEHASGRECHPYTMVLGDVARLVRDGVTRPGDTFVSFGCDTPCLLRQYGDGFRLAVERMGRGEPTVWMPTASDLAGLVGKTLVVRLYEGLFVTDTLVALAIRLRAYERVPGTVDRVLADRLVNVQAAIAAGQRLGPVLAEAAASLEAVPRGGAPGDRPVVGVTGDLYTRANATANSDLFRRLEALGCEVWASPAHASLGDLSSAAIAGRLVRTGRMRGAFIEGLAWALMAGARRLLLRHIGPVARELAVEPPPEALLQAAAPYVDRDTNYLVAQIVAKIADFLDRGADGVVTAAGINCMVGVSAAAAIPRIRADRDGAPVLSVIYGSNEGPAQRLRIETFVEQVKERRARRDARGDTLRGVA